MIVKMKYMIGNNLQIERTDIDKICSFNGCKKNELYYLEGINDNFLFKANKVNILEESLSYCTNKLNYPFVIFNNKGIKSILVSKKFLNDLKVINKLANRNKFFD